MYFENFYGERLFPKSKVNNLQTFQYKSENLSLAYNYFLSPLSDWIVNNIIPPWVAPNLLTILGFFINVVLIHLLLIK